jgi:hypothetical protein
MQITSSCTHKYHLVVTAFNRQAYPEAVVTLRVDSCHLEVELAAVLVRRFHVDSHAKLFRILLAPCICVTLLNRSVFCISS